MPRSLTHKNVEQYERDGILFPIPAIDEAEANHYRSQVEELEDRLGGRFRPMQVVQPQLHFRWAYDLAVHPRILEVVRDLLGPDVLVHSASIFCKHPDGGTYVAWHQDGHYWRLSEPRLVSAWVALSASTLESGCLRVVPGTHHDRLAHVEVPDPDNMLASGLRLADEIDPASAVDVILRPGQMSLHHERIVHGSEPNRSIDKRIGFAIRYVAPEVVQELPHHPVILASGQDLSGNYEHLKELPSADLEEGLARQGVFADAIRRRRLGEALVPEVRTSS